jgi:hypothetical protein
VIAAFVHRQPRVVIAHSFGAIPAFEALHAAPHVRVECLMTIGAPLAVPGAVFDRLHPAPIDGVGARPPGVHRWVNVADMGDPFTVLRSNRKCYPGIDVDVQERIESDCSIFIEHVAIFVVQQSGMRCGNFCTPNV